MERPYFHYAHILLDVVTPEFTIGSGCKINLDVAGKQLIKLVKAIKKQNKYAIWMSPASENFLKAHHGNPQACENTATLVLPKPVCYQPKFFAPRQDER